eukprot:gene8700-7919_t
MFSGDDMGGFGFPFGMMGGMGGGMGGQRRRPQPKSKGKAWDRPLPCSLEELFSGKTKKMKVSRDRIRGGRTTTESKVLEMEVMPGWKNGTKVTFPGEGNESASAHAGDIVFVVETKPHD